jgi:hypothetical protein
VLDGVHSIQLSSVNPQHSDSIFMESARALCNM